MLPGFHIHHFDEGFASAYQLLSKLPGKGKARFDFVCQFDAGSGLWLAAAQALGAKRLLGISNPKDSDQALCVDPSLLKTIDLQQVKVSLPQIADLVICINFAQHLAKTRAEDFVADLCASAKSVLFCAPSPHASAIHGENLLWPSAWAEYFAKNSFYPDLQYRLRIWPDRLIDPLLRQNTLLFIKRSHRYKASYSSEALDLVHPAIHQKLEQRQAWFARQLTRSTLKRIFGESIDPKT